MNKIMFIVAAGAITFIGWLYFAENAEVDATKTAITAAAGSTALKLAQSRAPERNTDADAEGIFKGELPASAALDELAVRQSLLALDRGRFRQSVKISARARTKMSEFFNMPGAEIEIVATHDFDR